MGATERIIDRLVPEWIEHQRRKAQDYNSGPAVDPQDLMGGFENADVLGIPGQFSEIWRKIWKLYKGMWKGETLVGEQPREILMDFIGHCFLAIDMIDRLAGSGDSPTDGHEVSTDGGKTWSSFIEPPEKRRESCGSACAVGHTFIGLCQLRRSNKRDD